MKRLTRLGLWICAGTLLVSACAGPPRVAPRQDTRAPASAPAPALVEPTAQESGWTEAMQATMTAMQQAALKQGSAAVARTLDDRLLVHLPVAAAFGAGSLRPNKSAQMLFDALGDSLHRHATVCATMSESAVATRAGAGGLRPHRYASAVRRQLAGAGVESNRLSIDPRGESQVPIGPPLPADLQAAPQLEILLYCCGA